MRNTFPTDDMQLTHMFVVSDIASSVIFYRDVLGAELVREYGGTSAVLQFLGNWLLLVTGGGPTDDKPTITLQAPTDKNVATGELIVRVSDCRAAYETLKERGAIFLTPPVDRGVEIRAFFQDPDGHLIEISELVDA